MPPGHCTPLGDARTAAAHSASVRRTECSIDLRCEAGSPAISGKIKRTKRPKIIIPIPTRSWDNCGQNRVNRLGKSALLLWLLWFERYMLPPWASWTVAKDCMSKEHLYFEHYSFTNWRSQQAWISNCGQNRVNRYAIYLIFNIFTWFKVPCASTMRPW